MDQQSPMTLYTLPTGGSDIRYLIVRSKCARREQMKFEVPQLHNRNVDQGDTSIVV